MQVAELLETKAKEFSDKPAFIFKDQTITFSQLRDYSFRLADSLKNLGIKKGDRVAIYLPNWPEYIYSYLAIWCCRATAVPLDFMLTEDELTSCICHCEAKILIAKPKANISLTGLREKCPDLKKVVICQEKMEDLLSFEQLLEEGKNKFPEVEIQDKDYAIIFYTSGTTGKPKGVLINYLQLEAPPKAMTHFVDFTPEDIALCALPFSHLGGLIYLQNNIVFGITIVLMERFVPLEFLKNIQEYRVTCLWIVPSMYYALLQLKEFESFDLSSIRWMVIFGAPSSPDALRRFYQYCPKAHLLHGWGLTETNAPTTVIPLGSKKVESVGKPAPWIEVKIFDENDQEAPCGNIGEIAVRGWVVTDGYYKDPQATTEAMRGGWFHTGDLGRFDSEGYLYIVGRIKEMIKVAGEIVFEPEIESAIHKHPDIAEVAAIGVPDKLRGEVPKAFVVLKEGSRLSEEELRYFCRQHLAHFKIPHYFEFTGPLPKNRAGKIDKESLRSES
ncbi:MAG: AMP-binding protein [Candidatus Omnitrophota bacterium]|nr:AMP-binding protein [Candidatus Omnitrophota bacterium]